MKSSYSPHNQLPAPNPRGAKYDAGHFYENTAKHLVQDTVRIMNNGLNIDIDKVIELEEVLAKQLDEIAVELSGNDAVNKYLESRHSTITRNYVADRKSKMRDYEYYLVEFKHSDMVHRSYFMDDYAKKMGWSSPKEKLPTGVGKWPVKLVRKYSKTNKVTASLLAGTINVKTAAIVSCMQKLAEDKADMYNVKYLAQVQDPSIPFPVFNSGSPQQKAELFSSLGILSEATSKDTGLPSWNRKQVERVKKGATDPLVKQFSQCFIDHSFAAIVKNNFIAAFYNYSVDGRLYGQYKLLGAKSGRYTSSNPNMLNTPSTGSRFAKPVKRCFTAPQGKIILAADYSALEDRVIASLTGDTNKCAIFLKNLDGHSLNALGYFIDEIAAIMEVTGDAPTDAVTLKKLVDAKDKVADAIRQKSKAPTFKLAYGGFPDADKGGVITQEIFDNYHEVLYPGITAYREEYVLPTAKKDGELHLGLGFSIKTDNPSNDIRTIANATCQFWSILTALTINKMHQRIDENGYEDSVKVISTIYDSIYFEIDDTPEMIQWTNNNLIEVMLVDFMEDQTVHNEANSDIGYNWADMVTLANNASIEDIKKAVKELDGTK